MTKNKLAIKQCTYYIGAQKDKIENAYKMIAWAIYCTNTMIMGCLYQLTADRKSSEPRSGRWMTAIF